MAAIDKEDVPFLAAALILSGPAYATGKKVTCHQIRAELASGKSAADVAKELKVSKKTVNQVLTGNAIKKHLGLELSPEEQQLEADYRRARNGRDD